MKKEFLIIRIAEGKIISNCTIKMEIKKTSRKPQTLERSRT